MYLLFITSLLTHVIFDFYLQSSNMVCKKTLKNKEFSKEFIYTHLSHAFMQYLAFVLAGGIFLILTKLPFCESMNVILKYGSFIFILHLIIDVAKEYINAAKKEKSLYWFILDQALHILSLVIIIFVINHNLIDRVPFAKINELMPICNIILVFTGILILIRPTSFFMVKFLSLTMSDSNIKSINLTKSHLIKFFDEMFITEMKSIKTNNKKITSPQVDAALLRYKNNADSIVKSLKDNEDLLKINTDEVFSSNKGGKWIGYVERIMIFSFYLLGQFTAIAAVMAIKTAFRFNDLKDDNDNNRSEYIMIGTFASFFVTIIIAVCIKHFLSYESYIEIITWIKKFIQF